MYNLYFFIYTEQLAIEYPEASAKELNAIEQGVSHVGKKGKGKEIEKRDDNQRRTDRQIRREKNLTGIGNLEGDSRQIMDSAYRSETEVDPNTIHRKSRRHGAEDKSNRHSGKRESGHHKRGSHDERRQNDSVAEGSRRKPSVEHHRRDSKGEDKKPKIRHRSEAEKRSSRHRSGENSRAKKEGSEDIEGKRPLQIQDASHFEERATSATEKHHSHSHSHSQRHKPKRKSSSRGDRFMDGLRRILSRPSSQTR